MYKSLFQRFQEWVMNVEKLLNKSNLKKRKNISLFSKDEMKPVAF